MQCTTTLGCMDDSVLASSRLLPLSSPDKLARLPDSPALAAARQNLFTLLSSNVWNERMAAFWIARLNAVAVVVTMLSEAAAAGPLLRINHTTGGGAAWGLGRKLWLSIRRFELAGALVARQCRCEL